MKIAAFILARAGSKGLPGKNIIDFMGKPLIAWSIDAARGCDLITDIIVSTDGEKIAQTARDYNCKVMMRGETLSNDTALPKDAIRYHLSQMETQPEITVLLQPTSPLRLSEDITNCLTPLLTEGYDSAATFMKAPKSPYHAWTEENDTPTIFVDDFNPWQPRQALPPTYCLNGACYAMKTDIFLADDTHSFLPGKAKMVLMPDERSVDIDTKLDLDIAAAIYKAMQS